MSLDTRPFSPDHHFHPYLDAEAQTLVGWLCVEVWSGSLLVKPGFRLTTVLSWALWGSKGSRSHGADVRSSPHMSDANVPSAISSLDVPAVGTHLSAGSSPHHRKAGSYWFLRRFQPFLQMSVAFSTQQKGGHTYEVRKSMPTG